MTPINKADAADAYDRALESYAQAHSLTKAEATLEFAQTEEAKVLYKNYKSVERRRSEAIAKGIASGVGFTLDEATAFEKRRGESDAQAMARVLSTPEGAEMYKQIKNAKAAAQFPGAIDNFKKNVLARMVAEGEPQGFAKAALAVARANPSLYAMARLAGLDQIDGMPC